MKRAAIAVVLAAALAGGGAFAWRSGLFEPDTAGTLVLYGNVDVRNVDLAFRVGGRIEDMPVDEGAAVRKGDVVAKLDAVPLQQALAAANAQVSLAQAERDKAVAGNRAQEIAQARALVAQREASLWEAELSFTRADQLEKSSAVSEAVRDEAEARWRSANAMLVSAQEALSLQEAGSRAEDIAAAEARLAAAIAARDQAETALEDAVLHAAQDGTVMTRAREPGAIVAAGATVFTVAIDRPVRVRAYVPEPDLGAVVPGQSVEVTTDSSDRVYDGVIGFVSPTAEFTPKSVQTPSQRTDLVFRMRIIIDAPDDALRQGMPVTVTIPQASR